MFVQPAKKHIQVILQLIIVAPAQMLIRTLKPYTIKALRPDNHGLALSIREIPDHQSYLS